MNDDEPETPILYHSNAYDPEFQPKQFARKAHAIDYCEGVISKNVVTLSFQCLKKFSSKRAL